MPSQKHHSRAATVGLWIGVVISLPLAVFFGGYFGGAGGDSVVLSALLAVLYAPLMAVGYATYYLTDSILGYSRGDIPMWLGWTLWLSALVVYVLFYAFLGRAIGGWWGRRRDARRTKDKS